MRDITEGGRDLAGSMMKRRTMDEKTVQRWKYSWEGERHQMCVGASRFKHTKSTFVKTAKLALVAFCRLPSNCCYLLHKPKLKASGPGSASGPTVMSPPLERITVY